MLRVQGTMRDAYTIESDQKKVGHIYSNFHLSFFEIHLWLYVPLTVFVLMHSYSAMRGGKSKGGREG